MKGPFLILLCVITISNCNPISEVSLSDSTLEIVGGFEESTRLKDATGIMELQSGPFSITAGRDSSGTLAGGLGFYETGPIPLGKFGKVSLKATSSLTGMYNAILNTEVFSGDKSYTPLTLQVNRKPKGIEFIGTTDLGIVEGTYITSTQSDVIPIFEINFNTNGYLTATAKGRVKNGKIQMTSYSTGFNIALFNGVMNMDGDRNLLDYELGASLGLVHGAVKFDRTKNNQRSYKAGLSVSGTVDFDTEINADNTKTYNAVVDTGIFRLSYNMNKNEMTSWKGSLDLANIGIDFSRNSEGIFNAGGRIQIGSSVFNIHRDSSGYYEVKINRGSIVE